VPEKVKRENEDMPWPERTITVTDDQLIELPIPGQHWQSNARLALRLARVMGVEEEVARRALRRMGGIGRRFEKLGKLNGMEVISDYGHHPTEIAATWQAARGEYNEQKILVVVEVHMLERLEEYVEDYVFVLSKMSEVVLTPVFLPKGREGDRNRAVEKLDKLEQELSDRGVDVHRLLSYEKLGEMIQKLNNDNDVMLVFSAGKLDGELRKLVR